MDEVKPWYLSETVWAAILQILLNVGFLAGFVDPVKAAAAIGAAPGTIVALITMLLGVVVIHGRVTATKTIA